MTTITHDLRDTLEGKEVEIYRLLCQNLSNREIALAMNIPAPTIQWHLRNIYMKLGVSMTGDSNNAQLPRRKAVAYAGTRIEQVVSFSGEKENFFSIRQIRNAAKKIGCSVEQVDNLISFLEMESDNLAFSSVQPFKNISYYKPTGKPTGRQKGEGRKLTDEQIEEIKLAFSFPKKDRPTQQELADKYGVSRGPISRIFISLGEK